MMGAGDIAGAAGAGADPGRGLDHGAHHLRMLSHPEIVVGAPDHDVARPLGRVPHRMGKPPRDPFQIGENTITPLIMQAAEGVTEELAVIHHETCTERNLAGIPSFLGPSLFGPSLFRTFPALMSSANPALGSRPAEDRVASGADQMLILIKMLTDFAACRDGTVTSP